MAGSLRDMLTAFGLTPTAGQSFAGNVPGATGTTKFSDYIQTGASWDAPKTFPGLNNPNNSYTCNITFTEGSGPNTKAFEFRMGGSAVSLSGSAQVSKSGESLGSAFSGTVTAVADGVLDLSSAGVASTQTVPASPIAFGSGGGAVTVHFIANPNSNTSSSDHFMGWTLTLSAAKTGYPFNSYAPSGVTSGSYSADVRDRNPGVTEMDFEWYNDAFFSSFYASGNQVTFTQTAVGQDKTLWVQWRIKPALNGGVTTYHQVSTGCVFTDNR